MSVLSRPNAGLDPDATNAKETFQEWAAAGLLRFPLLSSIRVSVERRQDNATETLVVGGDSQLEESAKVNMIVVEACEQDLTMAPNAAYTELLSFVTHCAPRDDGVLAATLDSIKVADHYAMQVELGDTKRPCAKVLALILATERTRQSSFGPDAIRLTTRNVLDALGGDAKQTYELVTMCQSSQLSDVLLTPPCSGSRQLAALVLITGVPNPNEFMVQAAQPVAAEDLTKVMKTMRKLIALTKNTKYDGTLKRPIWRASESNPVITPKKCKQLGTNPSDASFPDDLDEM